jgi:hypothetical protein
MVSQNFTRSEYDHCVYSKIINGIFIILVLYVDDMLIVGKKMVKINRLKAQLARMFDMKDLRATKNILGIKIHRDEKNGRIWLSQQRYVENILIRFYMNHVKPIDIPLDSSCYHSKKLLCVVDLRCLVT